jgi:hypothetical protein
MSDKTIVCPQCLKQLVIPDKSDPQAEQLYLYMKQKGNDKETTAPRRKKSQQQTNAAAFEKDEVDKWIDEFWTTLPENNTRNKPAILSNAQNKKLPQNNNANNNANNINNANAANNATRKNNTTKKQNENQTESQQLILRNDKILLVAILLTFFLSFPAGFVLRGFFVAGNSHRAVNEGVDGNGNAIVKVEGKLSYKNEFGVKTPDADATILFIPVEAKTPTLISTKGLRADDGIFDPNNDNIQRITELGGIVQRTGADGGFNFTLKSSGKYVAIMISSHAKRTNATQLPPEIINYLTKFFKNPTNLPADFRIEKDEYNINNGTQIIHKTFE